ncbi:IS1380-like element ISAar11 family transposase [Glutamicibacter arilaitensis]|uniref:Transposase of ISAar11, IS1380 family n=1 Tax=Glutamicibacter arilaitensis (strain DSM 16368 / CIP 108037 / IAM 15318 / JCM 13566 / NCIMB 14258 / Re117) TaxID=861360 RepID=A0ABM9PZ10_GLUAR|nr:IS1380-like element ISAar11 family transposase [Glutamicibacter arilaitensis]CBT76502.1 transposase of ISAar11, IS1380 family [Glutamicibacter arilaitensis Re117]
MNHSTRVFPALPTQLTSQALVSHAGLSVLSNFLNALDFQRVCEDRFSQFAPATAAHRPGRILGALALSLAAGGEQATDIDQLRAAPDLFGPVASDATVSRFMHRIKEQPEAFSYGFATMTRTLRSKAWTAAGPRNPARQATANNPLIIDIDASLVHVHSDKEHSAGTYKGGYGFSPMIAMADYGKPNGTGEVLAVHLRPGNRGANSAASHIEVLTQALAQLPDDFYDEHGNLIGEKILVRTDSAGSSREFLHHLDSLRIQFSTSYSLPVIKERFIRWIDEKKFWEPALDADGVQRDNAWVIDASKVIELKDYPPGTRIYLRAEPLHPGAKANLFDTDGNRVTAFLTNSPRFNVAFLDARHRARGRCENRIKTLKNAGLGKLPYWSFAANQAWADLAMLALNLVSWLQLAALPGGHEAGCWDMKRWRYRLFSMAGKVVTGGRQRRLLIHESAPEAQLLFLLQQSIGLLFHRWRHGELAA